MQPAFGEGTQSWGPELWDEPDVPLSRGPHPYIGLPAGRLPAGHEAPANACHLAHWLTTAPSGRYRYLRLSIPSSVDQTDASSYSLRYEVESNMTPPTQLELEYHVEEIGWSLVSMCRNLFLTKLADIRGWPEWAQATFDASIVHARAIVEFLTTTRGGHIQASHYFGDWNPADAADRIPGLYWELNVHAAHLSRSRFKQEPAAAWDLAIRVGKLLDLFQELVDRPNVACRQQLFEQLTEARLQLSRFEAL